MRTATTINLQHRFTLLFLLCLALLLSSGKSMANHHEHDDADEHHGRMMKELNLNDAQKEAFKNAMKQMRESQESKGETHEQIRAIVHSDNYDEKKIREILQKSDKAREDNMVKSSKAMNDFYKSLSPEQRTKFTKMQKDMKGRMKERMKGDKHHHE